MLGLTEVETSESEALISKLLDAGISEVGKFVETLPGAGVADALGVSVPEPSPRVRALEVVSTRVSETTVFVEPEPADPGALGATETAECENPECTALTKEDSAELAVPDCPAVEEPLETRLESVPDVGEPTLGTPEPLELPAPFERPEPGALMVWTMVWTEDATDVGGPEIGAAPDDGPAGAETEAELGNPVLEFEAVAPSGAAVVSTVRMEVSVES